MSVRISGRPVFSATDEFVTKSDHLENNPAKFHPDPIWKDGVLGFFEDGYPNKKNKNNGISSDVGSVPDPEISAAVEELKRVDKCHQMTSVHTAIFMCKL